MGGRPLVTYAVVSLAGACVGYAGYYAALRLQTRGSVGKGVRALSLRNKPLAKEDIIIGCSSLAGMYTAIGEEQATETIKAALEAGFVDFDSAPHYGLGLSEERMGKGLTLHRNGRRFRVWTKVGRVMKQKGDVRAEDVVEEGNVPGTAGCIFVEADPNLRPVLNYSGKGVRQSYEDSLKRIGHPIYGLRVHDADDAWRLADAMATPYGGVEELVQMRKQGLIKNVSLGMNEPEAILQIIRKFPEGTINSVMMAGSWNLLDQNGAELLLECQARGIKVHNAGIFASGLLVGGSTYKYGPAPPEILQKTEEWGKLATKYAVPLPVVAFAFALLPSVIEKVAVGVKSPKEVWQNHAWLEATQRVPNALWRDAKAKGLLAECVPIP